MQAVTDQTPTKNPRVLISIATYNERENIQKLISEIRQMVPEADIVVIDDNSPDRTGDLLDTMSSQDSHIKVIHRAGKLGLGTAILRGMRFAIEHDYDIMVNMDADFSHHPSYIPQLLAGMKKADLVIGSRYIPGGGTTNWPASRKFMSGGVNLLVRLMFRMQVKDASGGFRAYRVAGLRQAKLDKMQSHGYSFQQEMLYRCHLAGFRLGEVPIIFENRKIGKSKVSLRETFRSLSMLVWMGFRSLLGADKPSQFR